MPAWPFEPEVPEFPEPEVPEPEVPKVPKSPFSEEETKEEQEEKVEEKTEEPECSEQERLAAFLKSEEQKERKRANSRAWHQKWESKGVPKKPRVDEPGVEAAASTESVAVATFKTLGEARDHFVKQWIAESDLPKSNERRNLACQAWMASEMRANFIAGRDGIQK